MTRAIRILSAVTVAVLALTGVGVPANGAPAPDIASGGNAPGGWSIGPSAYQDLFGSVLVSHKELWLPTQVFGRTRMASRSQTGVRLTVSRKIKSFTGSPSV